jgi:hypothetical protein
MKVPIALVIAGVPQDVAAWYWGLQWPVMTFSYEDYHCGHSDVYGCQVLCSCQNVQIITSKRPYNSAVNPDLRLAFHLCSRFASPR